MQCSRQHLITTTSAKWYSYYFLPQYHRLLGVLRLVVPPTSTSTCTRSTRLNLLAISLDNQQYYRPSITATPATMDFLPLYFLQEKCMRLSYALMYSSISSFSLSQRCYIIVFRPLRIGNYQEESHWTNQGKFLRDNLTYKL